MLRVAKIALIVAITLGLHQVVLASGSKAPTGGGGDSAFQSPAEMAKQAYNNGISHKDKGRKLEEQLEKQTFKDAKEQQKATAKVQDEYAKALKDFTKAAKLDATMFQAVNGMGYAYRKTGEPTKSLEAYDKALQMAPGFPDAIEYRGEAYLALGRVDDAKQAYLSLFSKDRTQADVLIRAMSAWVAKQPTGVDATTLASFDAWVKERAKVATTTSDMGLSNNHSIWK